MSEYNYILPKSLIAVMPPKIRGTSRLLVLDRSSGNFFDKNYSDISKHLKPGDVLVLNDTKVIKARINAINQAGMDRELLVLEKHSYDNDWYRHRVLYRGKLDKGDVLSVNGSKIMIDEVQDGGLAIVKSDQDLLKLTDQYGEVPLPPYMHRRAIPLDITRYQTIWGSERGSVAAPTASLNMTDDILTTLKDKGVIIVFLTLHVGLGTFLLIRTDNIEDHHMHKEYFQIPQNTIRVIQNAKANNRRVVALGTTVARTLEYAGEQLKNTPADLAGEADIFIYPGYKFKVVDSLMTNFHAPKSTVLMLTAAFAGWDKLLPAYNHAVESGYSFLSYGDSMLIL